MNLYDRDLQNLQMHTCLTRHSELCSSGLINHLICSTCGRVITCWKGMAFRLPCGNFEYEMKAMEKSDIILNAIKVKLTHEACAASRYILESRSWMEFVRVVLLVMLNPFSVSIIRQIREELNPSSVVHTRTEQNNS